MMHAEGQGKGNSPLELPAKKELKKSMHHIVKNLLSNRMQILKYSLGENACMWARN